MSSKLVGQRLKDLRKARGYSQADLAKMMNVSQQTIGNHEGGTGLDVETLVHLADALNASVHDIICESIAPTKNVAAFDLTHISLNTLRLLARCKSAPVLQAVEALLVGFEDYQKEQKSKR